MAPPVNALESLFGRSISPAATFGYLRTPDDALRRDRIMDTSDAEARRQALLRRGAYILKTASLEANSFV